MTTVGLVTIGQAPRTDITPDIETQLPSDVEVLEAGALDKYSTASDVRTNVGPKDDSPIFVTRLRDGTSVKVDRDSVFEHLQERIDEIEQDVETIGVLCTGEFPPLQASVPILEPSHLLNAWASAIAPNGIIGIMMPEREQLDQTNEKWAGYDILTAAGSPYADEDEITGAAQSLGTDADLIVMDCMGYTPGMKETVREITDTSVLLGRSVLGKTITELL